jgi:hypothetical protein
MSDFNSGIIYVYIALGIFFLSSEFTFFFSCTQDSITNSDLPSADDKKSCDKQKVTHISWVGGDELHSVLRYQRCGRNCS